MAVDKLVDSALLDAALGDIADVIRSKTGISGSFDFPTPNDIAEAIDFNLLMPTGTKTITANGSNIDVANYAKVDVNVSGGGSTNIDIGVEVTSIPNILNMFYALESGTAVTNEFTLTQAIPNTEVEVLDTGLSTVHGLFIADESQSSIVTGSTPENVLFAFVFEPTSTGGASYAVTRFSNKMTYGASSSSNGAFLLRCTWRVDGGKLYCKGDFNRNDSYTPFHSAHTYRWVAW